MTIIDVGKNCFSNLIFLKENYFLERIDLFLTIKIYLEIAKCPIFVSSLTG